MIAKVYLRIAKTKKGIKVAASNKPNETPLERDPYGGQKKYYPTVSFGVEFDIPDALFKKASTFIALINVAEKEAKINAQILSP